MPTKHAGETREQLNNAVMWDSVGQNECVTSRQESHCKTRMVPVYSTLTARSENSHENDHHQPILVHYWTFDI